MEIALAYSLKDKFETQLAPSSKWALEEHDSEQTIRSIQMALEKHGFQVALIGDGKEFISIIDRKRYPLVFNIAEGIGSWTREAHIPSVLEMLQIPYTHSDPHTLTICQDKLLANIYLKSVKIPSPRCISIDKYNWHQMEHLDLRFPIITKPRYEGSSIGIENKSVCYKMTQLRNSINYIIEVFHQPAILEEFCEGSEYTAGVIGNGNEARCIGLMEIAFKDTQNLVYGLEQKREWEQHTVRRIITGCDKLKNLAVQTHKELRCRDVSRIDIRLKGGAPHVIDVNPLPGLTEHYSLLPSLATEYSHDQLINEITQVALRRNNLSVK